MFISKAGLKVDYLMLLCKILVIPCSPRPPPHDFGVRILFEKWAIIIVYIISLDKRGGKKKTMETGNALWG